MLAEFDAKCVKELPPRARRIHFPPIFPPEKRGTTSACAENTLHAPLRAHLMWNYLRVRGEYDTTLDLVHDQRELPPRARRIRIFAITAVD